MNPLWAANPGLLAWPKPIGIGPDFGKGGGWRPKKDRGFFLPTLAILAILFVVFVVANTIATWGSENGIKAGYPATVQSVWAEHDHHRKHHHPNLTRLYIWTQKVDCSICAASRHTVDPFLWRKLWPGEIIQWDGDDHKSLITDKRWQDGGNSSGWDLYIKVKQCRPDEDVCWIDSIQVDPQTWLDYDNGDEIWFEGDKGEVIG